MTATVGIRQWTVLAAMALEDPRPFTVRRVRAVVHARNLEDWGRDVPPKLLEMALVRHVCPGPAHELELDCQLRLTAAGRWAKMSKRARSEGLRAFAATAAA